MSDELSAGATCGEEGIFLVHSVLRLEEGADRFQKFTTESVSPDLSPAHPVPMVSHSIFAIIPGRKHPPGQPSDTGWRTRSCGVGWFSVTG